MRLDENLTKARRKRAFHLADAAKEAPMNEADTGAAVAAKVATAVQNGGAAVSLFGGLTAVEWAAFGGLFFAFLGWLTSSLINWYFRSQHLKLAKKNQTEFYDE
jgi:hypothetical protein